MKNEERESSKQKKMEDLRTQPPRSTATTASTITICHHHLDPQESQPPPSKIEGQKNGEMPKRGRRVMRVVWEERKVQREKRKKQKGKGRSTTVIRERKGKKKNKIVLNIIAYLAVLFQRWKRASTLSYFTILKSHFINYTISFYNTPYIPKLYYFTFSLKYYFLIFLYYFFPIITFFRLMI